MEATHIVVVMWVFDWLHDMMIKHSIWHTTILSDGKVVGYNYGVHESKIVNGKMHKCPVSHTVEEITDVPIEETIS